MQPLCGNVFLLISGASQGIGKQIAETFAPLLKPGSKILLLARNLEGLNDTKNNLPQHLTINTASIDLSIAAADEITEIMNNCLKDDEISEFDQAIIVHNAGSLGNIAQKTINMANFTVWRRYYDLNVFSPAILNNVFMNFFGSQIKCKIFTVNITSLCALQPMKSLGYYCSGKAAREMFFKVFAAENPDVNVLNYSPGPVKTDMLNLVCQNVGDTEMKTKFKELKDKDTALSPEKTVSRLLQILVEQNYVSGDHVDYYDIL